ncbi:MAG TPA: alpha/beta hydrolase [Acidimicrobiales bacterium]|nr:alpha/beta hydrolase [Acidimicrobiales bacterium]
MPVLLAAGLLAGCTTGRVAEDGTTSVPGGSAPPTSIVPTTVPGTTESGRLSFLGSVERLPVMPVASGETATLVPSPGTRGYRHVVQVAYRQLGSGKPLVLIPGQDASMAWWSPPVLQTLAQHYAVTVFDPPGVGYSGPPSSGPSVQSFADVTAGLIGELGLKDPVVLGWGMGGQVALALAERHPGLAGDLVLLDTGIASAQSVEAEPSVRAVLDSPSSTLAELADLAFPPGESRARQAWLAELLGQIPDTVTSSAVSMEAALEQSAWSTRSLGAGTGSLKLPVLVMGGNFDPVFPAVDTVALASMIPGAQHYLWNGTGYAGFAQDPTQFATLVEDFTG